jgi:two-component sensor histidine kinase
MKQYFTNLSIRFQFLVVFLPSVALFITVCSYYSYKNEVQKLKQRELQKKVNIKEGVKLLVQNHDLSLKLMEATLENRIRSLYEIILDKHLTDLENQNFKELQSVLELNPLTEDLYLINRQGVIVRATDSSDLGFNFFEFEESYNNFLNNCWDNKRLFIERVGNEKSTNLPKKFAYQAFNNLYVLEIRIKLESIDTLVNDFNLKLQSLSDNYSNIKSIDLFCETDVLMSKDYGNGIDSMYLESAKICYETKSDTALVSRKEFITYTDFISIEMRDALNFKGYVLQIVSDDYLEIELINRYKYFYLITLFISLLFVMLLITYLTKKITNPIVLLSKKVKEMAKHKELKKINIIGNYESIVLSKRFNQLTTNINDLQTGLEVKTEERTLELSKKNVELENLLEERSFLIQEVHHRTKNNLQIISSLLSLQSRQTESKEVREVFQNSISRIQSMGLVYEKLYKNSNFVSVNSHKYLFDLVNLFHDNSAIKFNLIESDIELKSSQAVSIGLILNEFIINSYKHAFETIDNPEVRIELTKQDGFIHLSCKNNGVKLPDTFDINDLDSLGMTVIEAFTEKLNGEFTFKNQEQNGIELKIIFPVILNLDVE